MKKKRKDAMRASKDFLQDEKGSGIYRDTHGDDEAGRTSHDNHCVDLADRQSDFYGHIQPFAANAC